MFWIAAGVAQALAVASDSWLSQTTKESTTTTEDFQVLIFNFAYGIRICMYACLTLKRVVEQFLHQIVVRIENTHLK